MSHPTLFDGMRATLDEAIELTRQSLLAYSQSHRHWSIAYSGGKDSSATVTLIAHLIETGQIPAPKSLSVLYADTRMEIPPLHSAAMKVLAKLKESAIRTRVVLPELDDRFFVAMFGRGIPPGRPHFRWCTAVLKINPMMRALQELREEVGEKFLMITGVRLGESAQRDARIIMSCSRDGAECGQGWFQEATPDAIADTLAPLLHWRVCHVWDWLSVFAPSYGFPTTEVAWAYGGDEAEEVNARTGCMECPVAKKDTAVQAVIRQPEWSHLAPIRKLSSLYDDLSFNLHNRLRKGDAEFKKDGSIVRNPNRMGPLTMEARRMGLESVLAIQAEINDAALKLERPTIDLINAEEEARIHELIALNTWPDKWDGTEIRADEPFVKINRDGTVQPLLLQALEEA